MLFDQSSCNAASGGVRTMCATPGKRDGASWKRSLHQDTKMPTLNCRHGHTRQARATQAGHHVTRNEGNRNQVMTLPMSLTVSQTHSGEFSSFLQNNQSLE